jgi:PhnB protein
MKINAYLSFDGRCKQAFEFYQKVLGGNIAFVMTYGESPMAAQMPADQHDRILHTSLAVGDSLIMGADAPPQYFSQPQGFSVSISLEDTAEGERIFNALAENGNVKMPYGKTFWSDGFGMVIDQFGTPWMVNCQPAS